MRYKAYGHQKGNTEQMRSYFDGTYGCWGALHKTGIPSDHVPDNHKSNVVITNIDYCPPNGEHSIAYQLGYRPRSIIGSSEETRTKAIEVASTIVKAVIGDNITFEFTVQHGNQIWIKFSNFQHLPRNHVMWYMFAMRNVFEGGRGQVVKEFKSRGIKSLRKLAMAGMMVQYYKDSIRPEQDWMQASGMGGLNFLATHTTTKDIRHYYRDAKLKGPADTSFAEGNGYDCKGHGYGIQFSNCSGVSNINVNRLEQGLRRWDKDVIDSTLFQQNYVKTRASCVRALDIFSDFLKSLK